MSDRTAADIFNDMKPPPPGRASDVLDADRMVREGEAQARRQQEMLDDLNKKPRGGR